MRQTDYRSIMFAIGFWFLLLWFIVYEVYDAALWLFSRFAG